MMHSTGKLRRKVREVLCLAKGYWLHEKAMVEFVNDLLEPHADISDIRAAVEWNVNRSFVESRWDDEEERREWTITKSGQAKQQAG